MKKPVLIVAALGALVLAGCAWPPWQFTPPPPNQPQVSVVAGVVVVSPEPLAFRVGYAETKIVWQLPKNSNYRFPANGIVVEGQLIEHAIDDAAKQRARASRTSVIKQFDLISQDEIVCPRQDGGSVFTCSNKRVKTGYFKYTIRVVDGDKKELKQDPGVWNY